MLVTFGYENLNGGLDYGTSRYGTLKWGLSCWLLLGKEASLGVMFAKPSDNSAGGDHPVAQALQGIQDLQKGWGQPDDPWKNLNSSS